MTRLHSDKYKRIVFWIEHDSYDQFMLINALNQLELTQLELTQLELTQLELTQLELSQNKVIEVNHFPGTDRFIGFGQLPAEAIRSWFAKYQKNKLLPFLGDVMFYALLLPITKDHNYLIYSWNKCNSMVGT